MGSQAIVSQEVPRAQYRVAGPPVRTVSSWPRLLLAIVVGAGMVAACSGGGGTAAPASAGPAATAPAQSAAPAETQAPAARTAPDVTQAPAGAATVDVCAMLSAADVKTITGADTTGAAEDVSGWPDWVAGHCLWTSANTSGGFGIDVGTPASIAKSTSPTASEQLAIFKLGMQGFGDVEVVSGVGDGAVFASGFLAAIKGGSAIEITALTLEKDQLVAIAKLVLAKL